MSVVSGRSVLVTGGTGSFGRAFVRKILDLGAHRVRVLSRSESKQAQMAAELNNDRMRYLIGDVRDARRVAEAARGVDYVVHAAAMKRVETCEADPDEAIATNVVGTQNVARACIAAGVEKAVFLSTDKAAAPNTAYGFTKALAERAWCMSNVYSAGTETTFAATRYGNVLGSTGSVVPFWRYQYTHNLPITVTDERCTRFWMTMNDAVELVLLALEQMRGGEVFVPMCGSAPILDLARAIVEENGTYEPGHIEVGLRPGEKIHETLISDEEARHTWALNDHYRIEPEARPWGAVHPLDGEPLVDGFFSDTNDHTLTVSDLRDMING